MSKYQSVDFERLAEVFKALGNPHRLKILVHLASCCHPDCCGPTADAAAPDAAACHPGAQLRGGAKAETQAAVAGRSVGELGGGLSIVASTLSHHVKELSRAAVLSCAKRGKCVMCCIDRGTLREIAALFAALAGDAPLPATLDPSTKSGNQGDSDE